MSTWLSAIVNLMCVVRYMQVHVHACVTQTHTHISVLVLFYVHVCTLKNRCDSYIFKSYNSICLRIINPQGLHSLEKYLNLEGSA